MSGWHQRAHRLLEDNERTAEYGWLALWEAHIALNDHNEVAKARAAAGEIFTLARELGLIDLEMLALALEGLALVSEGQVDDLRAFIASAGFRAGRISIDILSGHYPSPADLAWLEAASSPIAGEVAGLDEASRTALARELTDALQEYLDDDGLFSTIQIYVASELR